MSLGKFHIAQVSFIKPILNELEGSGCNIQKISRNTGLSLYDLNNLENYIPIPVLYKVLNNICQTEGINNLSSTFDDVLRVTSLASWGEMIAFAPNVLSACRLAEKHGDALLSNERIGLEVNGPVSTYWQIFDDGNQDGKEQVDYIALTLALNGFRLANGDNWAPLELHFQSDRVDDLSHMLPESSNTKVYFNQPRSAIVFPTRLFNLPMLQNGSSIISSYKHENISSLKTKVIKLLDANKRHALPNLQVIADQFEVSSRTLQRHLSFEDSTFERIIDEWRFLRTLEMIEEPSHKIVEIAQKIGYANTSNFNRAFYRWTGTSPSHFREQLAKMSSNDNIL